MTGENFNNGGDQATHSTAWESFMGPSEKIDDNLKDDLEHIEHKLKHQYGYTKKDAERERQERIALHDQQKADHDNYVGWLERNQDRTASEAGNDFSGERNINGATGARRTFSEWDLQPKTGSNQEFGEQTRRQHDLTLFTELFPKDQDEDNTAYNQRITQIYEAFPRQEGEEFKNYEKRIRDSYEDNTILQNIVERTIKKDSEIGQQLQDDILNIADMQKSGRFDEQKARALYKEVAEKALREQRLQNLAENKQRKREELRNKLEEEKKKKHELEEKAKREEELKKREEDLKKQLAQEYAKLGPLAAVNADFTHDKKELAHDYAEIMLNEDQAKANLIKRIWKGNLFRKYYQKKYEREILEGKRSVGVDEKGNEIGIDEVIEARSGSAIERFVLGATEDMRYIHERIGKKDKNGNQDGEKLVEADKETTEVVRSAIEKFAKAKIPENGTLEDLKRDFSNEIGRLKAEARDQGKPLNEKLINNYFEVAMQARERVEHGLAIEKVMEGFKVYNADVRNNVRTEAHRDNIDRIVNKLESSKIGRFIPAEIIAAAIGSAWSLTQSGARTAAKVAVPVGGIAVSGALAGLRERNRVTEDRTRMMRDLAIGLEYGDDGSGAEGHRSKKRAKYEAQIGGTRYELKSAAELTSAIEQAVESGDGQAILNAIAAARVRIDFSDSEQKDLISYSSANALGDERLKLDIALIRAEKSLSPEDIQKLDLVKKDIIERINKNVDENDEDFRKIRALRAMKQAGKTIAIGSAVFFASQEIIAAMDPNKIGLFEKAGLIKTQNNDEAQETILAGLAGSRVRTEVHTDKITGIRSDQQTEIQQYEAAGYTKTQVRAPWTSTKQSIVDIDPSKSPAQVKVAYDGWANNGTSVSDGNELRMYLNNGQIYSGMYGTSTMGGQVLDYDAAAIAGKVKGYLTIGGSKFEIASKLNSTGQLTWGENGIFTTTTGETIRAIGPNGEKLYKYFEIALDNGADANGVSHIIPFATDIGRDTFSGKMQQVVDKIVEHPGVFDFTKTTVSEFPREVFTGGVFVAPTSRVGLGGPRVNPNTQGGENNEPAPTQTPENNPEPAPEPTPTSPTETQPTTGETATDEFTEFVRRNFGDIVGEDGVEFMTSTTQLNSPEYPRARLTEWWNGLSDEAKERVREFAESSDNNTRDQGAGLRLFLDMNRQS